MDFCESDGSTGDPTTKTPPASLSPPPLRFLRIFRRRHQIHTVFHTPQHSEVGTLKHARESLEVTTDACLRALDRITKTSITPESSVPEVRDLLEQIEQYRRFRNVAIILGAATHEYVGEATSLVVLSLTLLLSSTIVHHLCLLDRRWMNLSAKEVRQEHSRISDLVQQLLSIKVLWSQFPRHNVEHRALQICAQQSELCLSIVRHTRSGKLNDLISTLDKLNYWTHLKWSSRQDASLRRGISDITQLLHKVSQLCNWAKWDGLMFALPQSLAIRQKSLKTAPERANLHVQWALPDVIEKIRDWVRPSTYDFTLNHAAPTFGRDRENSGLWFIESEQYTAWKHSAPGSNERFLWCLGGIGMGKSVLMDIILDHERLKYTDHMLQERPIKVSIHFHYELPFPTQGLLSAMLQQVMQQVRIPTDLMVSLYEQLCVGDTPLPDEAILYSILAEYTSEYQISFFLDGIDECDPTQANAIINSLLKMSNTVRIICFSRKTSWINQELYPNFIFWPIETNKYDLEILLDVKFGWRVRPDTESTWKSARELVARAVENYREGFLLLAVQLDGCGGPATLATLTEIPDKAFDRYKDTVSRMNETTYGQSLRTIIAWVAVLGAISVTDDLPYLVPELPTSAFNSIPLLVDDSLGLLQLDGARIEFANLVAKAFFLTYFETFFPDFATDARASLSGFPPDTKPGLLLQHLNAFNKGKDCITSTPHS